MKPDIREQHQWLRQLVGDWTYEMPGPSGPNGEPITMTGTEVVRPIGECWIQNEGSGTMPDGSPATSIMTLGFDPDLDRFVGTFIGSMMTFLWKYEGRLDDSGKILTLDSEGPNVMGGTGMAKYQDIIELIDSNYRTLTGMILGDDGKWTQMMKAHYRRK